MSRKNLLVQRPAIEIQSPKSDPDNQTAVPEPPQRAPAVHNLGLMLDAMHRNSERAEEIYQQLSAADRIVEIDPNLVDPSPVGDRLPPSKQDEDAFAESVAAYGQRVPGLIRPSKTAPGRYVIVYGRRRLSAVKKLGKLFRTAVADLDDETAFVVQGLENNDREDLSFIERALYARELADRRVSPQAIAYALKTARSNTNAMISLARRLPQEVILAIGSSPTIGYPRWAKLNEMLTKSEKGAEIAWRATIGRPDFSGLGPAQRFDAVFHAIEAAVRPAHPKSEETRFIADAAGNIFAKFRRKRSGGTILDIPKAAARADGVEFHDWLADQLLPLREKWLDGG
jgi:ParB family chromosome partitioning protein